MDEKSRPDEAEERGPRLLEQVRNLMRLKHYSIHTERSYLDWIKRFVHFHKRSVHAAPTELG
jgi:Phage integrase, N-terminal SAM-like domain